MNNSNEEEIDLFAVDAAALSKNKTPPQTRQKKSVQKEDIKSDSPPENEQVTVPTGAFSNTNQFGGMNYTFSDVQMTVQPFVASNQKSSQQDDVEEEKVAPETQEEQAESKEPLDKFAQMLRTPNFRLKRSYRSEVFTLIVGAIAALLAIFPEIVTFFMNVTRTADSKLPESMFNGESEMTFQIVALLFTLICAFRIAQIRLTWRCLFGPLRLTSSKGFISKNTNSVVYNRIQTVECNQSPLGLLLNFGTVEVGSSGTSEAEVVLFNVLRPTDVANEIYYRMKTFDETNKQNIESFRK